MAKKRIPESNENINKEVEIYSEHSTLCGLSPVLSEKKIFDLIHENVHISQKAVDYRPTDKLVFVILGIMSGSATVYDLNQNLRVDKALLQAFGYESCADQSVIQQTLNAATCQNVQQLEAALQSIWDQNNMTTSLFENALSGDNLVTIDIDLSGQPASRNAEYSTKGYFAGKKNTYGRQLARVLVPETQEIVTESLYPGNTTSCSPFKAMVTKMEQVLHLDSKEKRQHIRLRLDGGFCTDENINYALWRGYQLLVKMRSASRAKKLAKSISDWVNVPSSSNSASREAGWVPAPHRYGRKTRQIVIRIPDAKKKSGYRYSVLITTDMETDLHTIVTDYDGRSGVPESSFCQDNQGLSIRKRRKKSFVAQQMLMLLSQLAHNLILWTQNWMIDAVEQVSPPDDEDTTSAVKATSVVKTLRERGMKRFVRQILSLSGKLVMKGEKVVSIILNPLYPLIDRIRTAFEALLKPFNIYVSLDEI
jgi:hypothetical protein